jgi:hypothetical protein
MYHHFVLYFIVDTEQINTALAKQFKQIHNIYHPLPCSSLYAGNTVIPEMSTQHPTSDYNIIPLQLLISYKSIDQYKNHHR